MRVLALIPARGGSKGVPRKNVRLLCGIPLITYTINAGRAAHTLSRLIVSTDDEEIAAVARDAGAEVPFMRPADLATDTAPTLPVVQHAVATLEAAGDHYDAICLLQPTNPLRLAEDIDGCVRLMIEQDATGVISTLPVPHEYNPHWVYFAGEDGTLRISTGESTPIPRRQALPPAFHRDGSVYVVRRNVLMNENSLFGQRLLGYPMPLERSLNIDTLDDWQEAERRICGGTR